MKRPLFDNFYKKVLLSPFLEKALPTVTMFSLLMIQRLLGVRVLHAYSPPPWFTSPAQYYILYIARIVNQIIRSYSIRKEIVYNY